MLEFQALAKMEQTPKCDGLKEFIKSINNWIFNKRQQRKDKTS